MKLRLSRISLIAMTLILSTAAQAAAAHLSIERLTWAGIKMTAGNTTVFIDAIGTDIWDGEAPGGLVPVEADTSRRYALITHTHNDHFDPATLGSVLGDSGYVICHESIATQVASRGLQVIPAAFYEPVSRGGFMFTAVPASDGFGAEQVSWIVRYGEQRFLHAGDTLWHGKWNLYGRYFGPFDIVFLPINGARLGGEPMPQTAGVLTPGQAVDAALLLEAREVVPIHFGGNRPPGYVEVPDPLGEFLETAGRRGVNARAVQPGDYVLR